MVQLLVVLFLDAVLMRRWRQDGCRKVELHILGSGSIIMQQGTVDGTCGWRYKGFACKSKGQFCRGKECQFGAQGRTEDCRTGKEGEIVRVFKRFFRCVKFVFPPFQNKAVHCRGVACCSGVDAVGEGVYALRA